MYHIFIGKQRALQFPVMCNACLKIGYTENIPDTNSNNNSIDDVGYGLWAHNGSFTIESAITPFDINGYGAYSAGLHNNTPTVPRVLKGGTSALVNPSGGSSKIMPATHLGANTTMNPATQESELYLSSAARVGHEMIIFFNHNFTLSLLNDTTHNVNNPAKYKIKATFNSSGSTFTVITDSAVISPVYSKEYFYSSSDGIDQLSGFNKQGRMEYRQVGIADNGLGGNISSGISLVLSNISNANINFFENKQQEVFVRNGQEFQLLGKVATLPTYRRINLVANLSRSVVNGEGIYIRAFAEPTYINKVFMVSCSYNDINKTVDLHLNGIKVKSQQINATTEFTFNKGDCFLGANGNNTTGAGSATSNKQFMGELHELSIVDFYKPKVGSTPTLLPNLDNTLAYFRFEEIDE
tara:strand:- start:12739 stop:13971 length:1233 start_codon:yes stop_codon:yes gene_type:complete